MLILTRLFLSVQEVAELGDDPYSSGDEDLVIPRTTGRSSNEAQGKVGGVGGS